MKMTGRMALAGITVLLGAGTLSFEKGLQQDRRTTCANHLAQIAGAKGSHGLENRLAPGAPVSPKDLSRLLKNGWDGLRCSSGGRYEPGLFTGDKETGDAIMQRPWLARCARNHGPAAMGIPGGILNRCGRLLRSGCGGGLPLPQGPGAEPGPLTAAEIPQRDLARAASARVNELASGLRKARGGVARWPVKSARLNSTLLPLMVDTNEN